MMASFCPTCSLASGSVSIILLTMIRQRSPILSPSSPWHLAPSPSLFFLKILCSFELHDTLSLEFYSSSLPFPDSSVSFVGFCFPFILIGCYCVLGPHSSLLYTPNQENIFYCACFKCISVIMMSVLALAQIFFPGCEPVCPTGPFASSYGCPQVLQIHCIPN